MEFVKTYPHTWMACSAFITKTITAGPLRERLSNFDKIFGIRRPSFASYVSKKFPYTYNGMGIVFRTEARPAKVLPIDSVYLIELLGYTLTEEKLQLLRRNFIFNSVKEMEKRGGADYFLRKYKELSGGHEPIGRYTELIFKGDIRIEPLAMFDLSDKELQGLKGLLGTLFRGHKVLCDPESLPRFERAIDYFNK